MAKKTPIRQPNLRDLELRMAKLRKLNASIAYQNALIDNERVIIELLQEQLKAGTTGTGEPTTLWGDTEYHPFTKRFKRDFGQGTGAVVDRITLYMFGDFYGSMYTTAKGETFTIKSRVSYFDKIIERSGPDVMRLSDDSMDILIRYHVNPMVEKAVTEALSI